MSAARGNNAARGRSLTNLALALLILALSIGAAVLGAHRNGIYGDPVRVSYFG